MRQKDEGVRIERFSADFLNDVFNIMRGEIDGWSVKALEDSLKSHFYRSFVALCGENAVAFCCYSTADEAELVFLVTDKSHRRTGIAEKLLSETLLMFGDTVLEVRSKNSPALALYSKLGFERIGLRKNMYTYPADDRVVMKKSDLKI